MADFDNEPSFPDIPLPLLERLERMYPDRAPDIAEADRQVWFGSGQAHLVRHLRFQFDKQNERSMKRKR
jgi:hypothetical protein